MGFQEVEAPGFLDNRRVKVVRLSVQRTGRLYPQEGFLVLISLRSGVDPRGTRIKSLKNSSDSIGDQTRDLVEHWADLGNAETHDDLKTPRLHGIHFVSIVIHLDGSFNHTQFKNDI